MKTKNLSCPFSHSLFFRGSIRILLVSALTVSCSSAKKSADIGPVTTSEKNLNPPAPRVVFVDEGSVGRMMAAQLAGRFGIWMKSSDALRYVNLVGQTLVDQAGRPGIRFRFGILNTDELEVASTPSGYVFVSRGFLRQLQSEHELAGILAHEIAHINEHHHQDLFIMKGADGTEEVTLSEARQVEVGIQKLLSEGFGKELQFEADAAACIYLATTGYSASQFASALRRISQSEESKKSPTFKYFKERASNLESFLQRNGLSRPGFADDGVLKKRYLSFHNTVKLKKN